MPQQQTARVLGSRPLLPSGRSPFVLTLLSPSVFVSFSQKENGRREAVHICDKAVGDRFSQAVRARWGTSRTPPHNRIGDCVRDNYVDDDTVAPQRCGIVHRLPQEPHPPRRAHDATGIPPLASQVVSKCALRGKRKAPRFPGTPKIIVLP